MPKAELKTKTNPNGHHPVAVWVRFGFQLGSLEKKCSSLRGKPCIIGRRWRTHPGGGGVKIDEKNTYVILERPLNEN